MSTEHVIGTVDDVPEGEHIVVEVNDREIGVFNIRGAYYALPNVCFHQNGPLCRGTVSGTLLANEETAWQWEWAYEGEIIVCPWHSLEFHITTGQCLAYPNRSLPTYDVKVEDRQIVITL